MDNGREWLRWGAWLTGAVSLLHVAIILGGPAWYRYFGAGERMARLAARGAPGPAVLTAGIASILAVSAIYGLSGAGVLRPLPLLRPVLGCIAAGYAARGVLGVPVVLLADGPYAAELRGRMPFMIITSLVCLALAACYGIGATRIGPTSTRAGRAPGASHRRA